MTVSNRVTEGLADLISAQGITGLSVLKHQQAEDQTYPCVVVSVESVEQHELIRENYEVTAIVLLLGVSEDETREAFNARAEELGRLLTDEETVVDHLAGHLPCADSWGGQGTAEPEDGYRAAVFQMTITAGDPS